MVPDRQNRGGGGWRSGEAPVTNHQLLDKVNGAYSCITREKSTGRSSPSQQDWEIVNSRELCICTAFREKKAPKPREKRSKSVVPEGSRGRGPRVQSSHCPAQASASGRGSQWPQALPLQSGWLSWSPGSSRRGTAEVGALPQAAWSSSVVLHGHVLQQLSPSLQISSRKCLQQIKPLKGNHKYRGGLSAAIRPVSWFITTHAK